MDTGLKRDMQKVPFYCAFSLGQPFSIGAPISSIWAAHKKCRRGVCKQGDGNAKRKASTNVFQARQKPSARE